MILGAIYSAVCNLQAGIAGQAGACSDYYGVPMARQTGRIVVGDVLQGEFAIVGVETTGQNAAHAEIMEIAALRVGPGLVQGAEFNVLVKPERAVAPAITRMTGIKQSQLDRQGIALHDAMRQLASFVTRQPVFAHNAPFDQQLLGRAAIRHGIQFDNPFYDSLLVAWSAWPGLPSYQLAQLAELLGLECQPSHRALTTAKATLALLREASRPICSA
jgi:DNA polymerase-3 subunit epsilon